MTFDEKEKMIIEALEQYPTFHEWFWNNLKSGLSFNGGIELVTEDDIKKHAKLSAQKEKIDTWGDKKGRVMNKTPIELTSIKKGLEKHKEK